MEAISNYYALSWFFFLMGCSSWVITFAYCVTRNEDRAFNDWISWILAFVISAAFIGLSKYCKMMYKLSPPQEVHQCMGLELYDYNSECFEEHRRYDDE